MERELKRKFIKLKSNLKNLSKLAIAYSGGVDSTFLLKVAVDVLGKENVLAITSCSETYPQEEFKAGKKLVKEIGAKQYIINTLELENKEFTRNDQLRCYYCKRELFSQIKNIAQEKGFPIIADGSNYDDLLHDYRPGIKAAKELEVKSPLQEEKLSKKEIRILSKELNLPTWNKAAFACLSSRFPYGDQITADKLTMVDKAEVFLRKYNFKQLRLRHHDQHTARIEVLAEDMLKVLENREEIIHELKKLGYIYITMDIEGYRTGSMNEPLNLNPS